MFIIVIRLTNIKNRYFSLQNSHIHVCNLYCTLDSLAPPGKRLVGTNVLMVFISSF